MKFLCEQDMVKASDEFKNGWIPMYCGMRMVILMFWFLFVTVLYQKTK